MSERSPTKPDPLRHLALEIEDLERRDLLRRPSGAREPGLLDLCSNDYLGYASDPCLEIDTCSGAGGSRLVTGDRAEHRATEAIIAEWLHAEAALLFSSGYAANVGTIAALAGRGDVIVSDQLNHASLIDGCRLSGATVEIFPHCDLQAAERALRGAAGARRRWMVTESYFSMDGDTPDLAGLRRVCDATDSALIVDEAHALGVFGVEGRGLCAAANVEPDVLIGTAGKALGLHGAFVVGAERLRLWLWNRARSFVFSTGVSPGLASAIGLRVQRTRSDEGARVRLAETAGRLRQAVGASGGSHGPIIPRQVGDAANALALSAQLRQRGLLVQAIRPPTVPPGTARLRLTASARLADGEVARAVGILRELTGGHR